VTTWLVPLKNGFSLIDEGDLARVGEHTWYVVRRRAADGCYATAKIGGKNVYLHRFIMDAKSGEQIDHINGDGLDNSRSNLRVATKSQNSVNRKYANKNGYRGVHALPHGTKWRAVLTADGKRIQGTPRHEKEAAARDYDALASEHFGAFAILNFPQERNSR
jgi:hypothetical protein